MTKTERLINRIKEVENFENVAWVCKNFEDFCFEVAEWGVDHAAGVDFDDPELILMHLTMLSLQSVYHHQSAYNG